MIGVPTETGIEDTMPEVERKGFEPSTPWLQTRCSPN